MNRFSDPFIKNYYRNDNLQFEKNNSIIGHRDLRQDTINNHIDGRR
jgi:hypothetical protein